MSMFLPESSNLSGPAQPGTTQITPSNPETTSEDVKLMQRVLTAAMQNPNLIPDQFMSYILDWIQTQRLIVPLGQVFGYQRLVGIRGSIALGGTTASGNGFTSSRSGTGVYVITFDTAFTSIPVVVVTASTSSPRFATLNTVSTTSATISMWSDSGVATDASFNFWAFPAETN